jgi:nitrite reductase/ring-hydroxylating ferredoxin subunit
LVEADFVKVAKIDEIIPSQMKKVEVEGQRILIANVNGKFYGIGNIYTPEERPLTEGSFITMKWNVFGMVQNLM